MSPLRVGPRARPMPVEDLAMEEWKARLAATPGAVVLDIRTEAEHWIGHIPGATLLPPEEVEPRIGELAPEKDAPLFLYCRTGRRSGIASAALAKMGYTRVVNMAVGGFPDWREAGYPVE